MKAVSNTFKNNIKQFGREFDCYISFNNTTIENEDINSISLHYDGDILKSIMRQVDIDSNVEIPVNSTLSINYGVKVSDGQNPFEYVNLGQYVVVRCEKQEDTESYLITAYDDIINSMKDYENMSITYPITVKNYLLALAQFLNISVNSTSINNMANADRIIPNELYLDSEGNSLGYTFRDVLDELSQVAGGNIWVNPTTNLLEVKYFTATGETIDEENLKDINVKFGEKFGKVNCVVLSRSAESDNVYLDDPESVEEYGLCEIKIVDNQIMNFDDRSDYLEEILEKVDGMEFYINDFSSQGIVYLDAMDLYNVQIGETIYPCVILNDEINITQGLEELIFTKRPKISKTDYTKADKTDRKINRTTLEVDKMNGVIQGVIETVNQYDGRIDAVEVTQTSQGQTIDIISKNINKETGEIESVKIKGYTLDKDGFQIKTDENDFNVLMDNTGTYYKDGNTIIARYTKDDVIVKNLVIYGRYYYGVNQNLDVANFKKDDALFVAERYTKSNGKVGVGHFWNGG